jgi:hypothetical protein
MFFFPFDFSYNNFGPNRRNWNEKSEAALRREREAKRLFDNFLEQCKTRTIFPVTEEIIPAPVHLTSACWKSFRVYVEGKGCTHKRREATAAERQGATRKGKMYVVSVTVPVHPDRLEQNRKEKETQAAAAAERKKEREAAKKRKQEEEAIRRAQEAKAYKAAVVSAYQNIMGGEEDSTTDAKIPAAAGSENLVNEKPVQTDDIIKHAETIYAQKRTEIQDAIYKEKRQLEEELHEQMMAKKRRLLDEAEEQHKQVKQTITEKHAVLKSAAN